MAKKKTTTKKRPSVSNEDLAPDRGRSIEKTIPIHELEDWIGFVPNLYKLDAIHLFDDHFRVNVWCEEKLDNHIYMKYNIEKSFHVVYKNGKFDDRSNPERKFETKYL